LKTSVVGGLRQMSVPGAAVTVNVSVEAMVVCWFGCHWSRGSGRLTVVVAIDDVHDETPGHQALLYVLGCTWSTFHNGSMPCRITGRQTTHDGYAV
jgi:hypothetical protein